MKEGGGKTHNCASALGKSNQVKTTLIDLYCICKRLAEITAVITYLLVISGLSRPP